MEHKDHEKKYHSKVKSIIVKEYHYKPAPELEELIIKKIKRMKIIKMIHRLVVIIILVLLAIFLYSDFHSIFK